MSPNPVGSHFRADGRRFGTSRPLKRQNGAGTRGCTTSAETVVNHFGPQRTGAVLERKAAWPPPSNAPHLESTRANVLTAICSPHMASFCTEINGTSTLWTRPCKRCDHFIASDIAEIRFRMPEHVGERVQLRIEILVSEAVRYERDLIKQLLTVRTCFALCGFFARSALLLLFLLLMILIPILILIRKARREQFV